MSSTKQPLFDHQIRRIKSFVTRSGRVSSGQQKAIDLYKEAFCIEFNKTIIDFNKTFNRDAQTILEIGFGMGETTAAIAKAMPDKNFIGVEVHTPGVGALLKLITQNELSNIRIIQHDAVEVIEHMIAPLSLAGIHIFFPDPWHKARHNKRRLIQSDFVKQLATRLAPGGYLHCATDWQDYAEQMLSVLSQEKTLKNTTTGFSPKPDYRPTTKFEHRGIRLGHGVWDLIFIKI